MSTPTRDGRHRRHRRDARRPDAHPSFVRRPSSPTTAGMHSFMDSSRLIINHDPGRSPRGPGRTTAGLKGCVRKLHTLDRIVRRICPSAYVRLIRTHTPYCTGVCPVARTHRSVAASSSARPDDSRGPDDRESATRGRRREATRERGRRETMSGGLPYGLQSMLKVRETTRRDGDGMDGWMDGMREGRAMDGWMMTRWATAWAMP